MTEMKREREVLEPEREGKKVQEKGKETAGESVGRGH